MNVRRLLWLALVCTRWHAQGSPITVDLGTAGTFAVLAGSTVTNNGATTILGDLGVWPGSAVTGFPPGIITGGTLHAADSVAMQAQADLTTAQVYAAGVACGANISADLGGTSLTPGVYCTDSSAGITGALTLDAFGDPDAIFLFQIGTSLTTASDSSVLLTNGAQGKNVFWLVGTSATLGSTTAFAGNLLASASISLGTGATIQCGSALASTGAVTLEGNQISVCQVDSGSSVPEPGTQALLGFGLLLAFLARRT